MFGNLYSKFTCYQRCKVVRKGDSKNYHEKAKLLPFIFLGQLKKFELLLTIKPIKINTFDAKYVPRFF